MMHTLLSYKLVIPEEMYTLTHLHTYETMQTDSHKLLLIFSILLGEKFSSFKSHIRAKKDAKIGK